jgi:hypothetical protein
MSGTDSVTSTPTAPGTGGLAATENDGASSGAPFLNTRSRTGSVTSIAPGPASTEPRRAPLAPAAPIAPSLQVSPELLIQLAALQLQMSNTQSQVSSIAERLKGVEASPSGPSAPPVLDNAFVRSVAEMLLPMLQAQGQVAAPCRPLFPDTIDVFPAGRR